MKLEIGDAILCYDTSQHVILFEGSMRLASILEYGKVKDFIRAAFNQSKGVICFDISQLKFLNSSGITTISTFILECKKNQVKAPIIKGTEKISWQAKGLKNFKKLWNEVELVWI